MGNGLNGLIVSSNTENHRFEESSLGTEVIRALEIQKRMELLIQATFEEKFAQLPECHKQHFFELQAQIAGMGESESDIQAIEGTTTSESADLRELRRYYRYAARLFHPDQKIEDSRDRFVIASTFYDSGELDKLKLYVLAYIYENKSKLDQRFTKLLSTEGINIENMAKKLLDINTDLLGICNEINANFARYFVSLTNKMEEMVEKHSQN